MNRKRSLTFALIGLMVCAVVAGGVYATWAYAEAKADEASGTSSIGIEEFEYHLEGMDLLNAVNNRVFESLFNNENNLYYALVSYSHQHNTNAVLYSNDCETALGPQDEKACDIAENMITDKDGNPLLQKGGAPWCLIRLEAGNNQGPGTLTVYVSDQELAPGAVVYKTTIVFPQFNAAHEPQQSSQIDIQSPKKGTVNTSDFNSVPSTWSETGCNTRKAVFKVRHGLWDDTVITWPDGTAIDRYVYVLEDENGDYIMKHKDIPCPVTREGYGGGTWKDEADAVPDFTGDVALTGNKTYTRTFENIAWVVTFKISNGRWADGTTGDKFEVVQWNSSTDKRGTLNQSQIPTGMLTPAEDGEKYGSGAWDPVPNTSQNAITGDVTYTYAFSVVKYKITFRVVNGTWRDGTIGDKAVYVEIGANRKGMLKAADIPKYWDDPPDEYYNDIVPNPADENAPKGYGGGSYTSSPSGAPFIRAFNPEDVVVDKDYILTYTCNPIY